MVTNSIHDQQVINGDKTEYTEFDSNIYLIILHEINWYPATSLENSFIILIVYLNTKQLVLNILLSACKQNVYHSPLI